MNRESVGAQWSDTWVLSKISFTSLCFSIKKRTNQYHRCPSGIKSLSLHVFSFSLPHVRFQTCFGIPQFFLTPLPQFPLHHHFWKQRLMANVVAAWNTHFFFPVRPLVCESITRPRQRWDGSFAAAYPTDNIERPKSQRNHSCCAGTLWPCSCPPLTRKWLCGACEVNSSLNTRMWN